MAGRINDRIDMLHAILADYPEPNWSEERAALNAAIDALQPAPEIFPGTRESLGRLDTLRAEFREHYEQGVRNAVRALLNHTKAASIVLPLPYRPGYFVAIGTAEGIRGTLEAAQEKVEP